MMKHNPKDFQVRPGKRVHLKHWPTHIAPAYRSDKEYKHILEDHIKELSTLQALLYASHRYALLLILQAMDAAGKDGAIKHVMSGVNPQGCQVFSFTHPSAEELAHDFLWRTTRVLPQRGHIGIFNRSYYEEVLVVRVHPDLLEKQHLPSSIISHSHVWDHRFQSINDYEKHLTRNGTNFVKIFL